MRENIIISGLVEDTDETEDSLIHALFTIFSTEMGVDTARLHIVSCHRLGRTGLRDVIARFSTHQGKKLFMIGTKLLKGREDPLYINDQFPREVEHQRHILRPG